MPIMPQIHDNGLVSFHRFIAISLEAGDSSLTPEEALDLWRAQNPLPKDLEETKVALDEALRDMESGDRGVPLEQFDREFRNQRNIPVEP